MNYLYITTSVLMITSAENNADISDNTALYLGVAVELHMADIITRWVTVGNFSNGIHNASTLLSK